MEGLVEVTEEPGNLSRIEKDLAEAVQNTPATAPAGAEKKEADESLPVKLRGKTREEIAEMYVNLESVNGRMANDLGAQRRLTDQFLSLKRDSDLASQQPTKPKPAPVKVDELLDKPQETLERFTADRDQVIEQRVNARLNQIEANMAQDRFMQRHPDYNAVAADPGFTRWLQASPYRSRLANAAYNGDWTAGDELMTEYKLNKQAPTKSADTPAPRPQNNGGLAAARAASLESSSAAPAGATSASGGKTYKRTDLMELRLHKPEVYYDDTFQAEILRAYNEGRVK